MCSKPVARARVPVSPSVSAIASWFSSAARSAWACSALRVRGHGPPASDLPLRGLAPQPPRRGQRRRCGGPPPPAARSAPESARVASSRDLVARIGRLDPPVSAVLALLRAAITRVARRVMHFRVAAVREVAIAGCLIAIRSCLFSSGGGLVAVRTRLVSLREELVAISQRLTVLDERLLNLGDVLLLYLDRAVLRRHGMIAWRSAGHNRPPDDISD